MRYLKEFDLLTDIQEHYALDERNIFNSYYPFGFFYLKDFTNIKFDNITIFYGDNGSGKSTVLNIIAEKLNASRNSKVDKGPLFSSYVKSCSCELIGSPMEIKIVTSDDIFDYLLDIRSINSGVNREKERLSREYLKIKLTKGDNPLNDYEELKKYCDTRNKTLSKYVRERLGNNNIQEQSNGESALMFWEKEIKDNSIYILDEPENSLSPLNQLKLKQFIEESARFFNCQFIISTHSPFLLDLIEAKIYDLDSTPVVTKKWNELENVKIYHDFFKERNNQFDNANF